ncbi:MAG: F-box-like domain-containing protein [Kistimonas sp.]|nr:F-box-like domain-containing protein [Kistimonas sp.]
MATPPRPLPPQQAGTSQQPPRPDPQGSAWSTAVLPTAGYPLLRTPDTAAQTLPCALLRRIFDYVPLANHDSCALVCRHWHANIPGTRTDITQWLAARSFEQRQASRHLLAGYSQRIRPLLLALQNPLLPMLDCQHQELLHRQEQAGQIQEPELLARAQQHIQTAQNSLAGLVQYSLHQQLAEAEHLELQPTLLPGDDSITGAQWSPCSRWLAMAQQDTEADCCLLRLYGWQQDSWHPETLLPLTSQASAPQNKVSCFAFSNDQPTRLFTGHDKGRVLSWHQDAGAWYAVPVLAGNDNFAATAQLVPCSNKDLLAVFSEQDASCPARLHWRVVTLRERESRQTWICDSSRCYDRVYAVAAHQHQVSIATWTPESYCVLDVWQHSLSSKKTGPWTCQRSVMAHMQNALALHYSPDGRYLLGLLSSQHLVLWQLVKKNRLEVRLLTPCAFSLQQHHLQEQRLFHQDGKQLVVTPASDLVDFWVESSPGHWDKRESVHLDLLFIYGPHYRHNTDYIQWCADGQQLTRVTRDYVDIWRKSETGVWQPQVLCSRDMSDAFMPHALVLPSCDRLCATALWQESRLWIHGANAQGQHTKKAGAALQGPVTGLKCSPDGLSFLVHMGSPQLPGGQLSSAASPLRLVLMQLTAPHRASATGRAPLPPTLSTHQGGAAPAHSDTSWRKRRASSHDSDQGLAPARKKCPPHALDTAPGLAQTLPPELLLMIFDHLSFAEQMPCALVCRHWHTYLPARRELSDWFGQQGPSPAPNNALLPAGYHLRTQPWLARCNSLLLPVLQRQHQQLVQLHEQLGPHQQLTPETRHNLLRKKHKERHLLAGLIHCGLHQQLSHTRQLALELAFLPLPVPSHEGTAVNYIFSPCSRWLATAWRYHNSDITKLLLYGWKDNRWQLEHTDSCTTVGRLHFSPVEPATLFTSCNRLVRVWKRAAATHSWNNVHTWHSPLDSILDVAPMGCGDLVVWTRGRDAGKAVHLLVFFSAWGNNRRWKRQLSWFYTGDALCPRYRPQQSLLALPRSIPATQPGYYTHEVHIWKKGLRSSSPHDWDCQISVLAPHTSALQHLDCCADGRLLVALYQDRQVALWTLNRQYSLENQLTLCNALPLPPRHRAMSALVSFRHDGAQLALAPTLHQIQLWDRKENGSWQPGEQLEAPISPDDPCLESLQLSNNGRTLLRTSTRQLDIWHKDADDHWQWQLHHRAPDGAPAPLALLAGPDAAWCLTATGIQGGLCLYAPDSEGQLVRKVAITVGTPVTAPLRISEDGLSLLFGTRGRACTGLLTIPAESGSGTMD